MSDDAAWRGWPQAKLDAAYNNMAAVPDSQARLDAWSVRSAALRARQPDELEIPYGDGQRQRFDLFRCGVAGAPLLAFIHGGWWQRNSKEVFSCMAEGPMAAGFDVAMLGYTLAPEAGLTRIVGEMRRALDALVAHEARPGRSPPLLVSGWSAGGHLAAMMLDHPAVCGGLSISGVFDLAPIRRSYINDKLQLTEDEVVGLSPLRRPPPGRPLLLVYGSGELAELRRQSEAFAVGRPGTRLLPLAGHDHFSILEELATPGGLIVGQLGSAIDTGLSRDAAWRGAPLTSTA